MVLLRAVSVLFGFASFGDGVVLSSFAWVALSRVLPSGSIG